MSENLRTFFAVTLSEEARQAAARLAGRLRGSDRGEGVRWVRPEGYHLTLRFLGNVGRQAIAELVDRVGEEVTPLAPFAIQLGGALVFPSPRNPRVVALAVEPEALLATLAERVERGVVAVGKPQTVLRARELPGATFGRRRRGPAGDDAPLLRHLAACPLRRRGLCWTMPR